jgi:hypothetical protein
MDRLDQVGSIRRVTYYMASPVHCCDRCSQGIKHVFRVTYVDGLTQEYGIECINKILATEPTLRQLFNKNSKLLQKRQRQLRALSMPEVQMPRGREYYGSGLYFVADEKGEDVFAETHWFFHPLFDEEKNSAGTRYVIHEGVEEQEWRAKARKEIEQGKVWLAKEIERLELFLAKVLRNHKTAVAGGAQ